MVASFEPGEGWRWCHADEALAQPHRKDPGGALRVPHDSGDNTANYPGRSPSLASLT
jgi:hypothetical protein